MNEETMSKEELEAYDKKLELDKLPPWGLPTDTPDKWTTDQLEKLMDDGLKAHEDEKRCEEEMERHRARKNNILDSIRQYLEYYGKDKHVGSLGTVERVTKLSFRTPKTDEDKCKFFKWLQEKEIFFQYATVNSQSLNSLLKQEFETATENGKELSIPGIEAPTEYTQMRIRPKK